MSGNTESGTDPKRPWLEPVSDISHPFSPEFYKPRFAEEIQAMREKADELSAFDPPVFAGLLGGAFRLCAGPDPHAADGLRIAEGRGRLKIAGA